MWSKRHAIEEKRGASVVPRHYRGFNNVSSHRTHSSMAPSRTHILPASRLLLLLNAAGWGFKCAESTNPRSDNGSIPLVVANGCFWGRQHIFAHDLELQTLNRTSEEVTAIAGYFGGSGGNKRVCYDNSKNISVYSQLGHAEAVQLEVRSEAELSVALQMYFASFVEISPGIFGREDYIDRGPQYRAIVGVPGGAKGPYMPLVRAANLHNMTLVDGAEVKQVDTLGKSLVYVLPYDGEGDNHLSDPKLAYRFSQAELCLQFHDNQTSTYPETYHALREALQATGRLVATTCPSPYPCEG